MDGKSTRPLPRKLPPNSPRNTSIPASPQDGKQEPDRPTGSPALTSKPAKHEDTIKLPSISRNHNSAIVSNESSTESSEGMVSSSLQTKKNGPSPMSALFKTSQGSAENIATNSTTDVNQEIDFYQMLEEEPTEAYKRKISLKEKIDVRQALKEGADEYKRKTSSVESESSPEKLTFEQILREGPPENRAKKGKNARLPRSETVSGRPRFLSLRSPPPHAGVTNPEKTAIEGVKTVKESVLPRRSTVAQSDRAPALASPRPADPNKLEFTDADEQQWLREAQNLAAYEGLLPKQVAMVKRTMAVMTAGQAKKFSPAWINSIGRENLSCLYKGIPVKTSWEPIAEWNVILMQDSPIAKMINTQLAALQKKYPTLRAEIRLQGGGGSCFPKNARNDEHIRRTGCQCLGDILEANLRSDLGRKPYSRRIFPAFYHA